MISGSADCDILPEQSISYLTYIEAKFDVAFCSSLTRCRSTINLIPSDKITSINYTDELWERDMGILEGMNREEAREKYPHLFHGKKADVNAIIPNGESINDVIKRVSGIVKYLNENQEKNILICSHNQTLKVLYFTLKNIEIDNNNWGHLNFPNGTLICVDNMNFAD